MQGHVGKLFPQLQYHHGGSTGNQEAPHVLDAKRVNSCQLVVILKIVLTLVGVQYAPRVRDGTLYKPTGATGGINTKLSVVNLIEIIEDMEYVHTGFRSLFAEVVNCVIRIVGISHGGGAAQQDLKRNVRYRLPQCFETLPGIFVQEIHGDAEDCNTPHLKGEGVP